VGYDMHVLHSLGTEKGKTIPCRKRERETHTHLFPSFVNPVLKLSKPSFHILSIAE
jgi:hypothetical protein